MSFGVGFGDVYTLCKLVNRTHTGWRDACGDYASFTSDLALLESVLTSVEAEVKSPNSRVFDKPEDAEGWRVVSDRCSTVVTELEGVLKSYKTLGSSRRRNWVGIRHEWDKLRFGNRNCEDLHRQLSKATEGLTAYVAVLGLGSHNRIEHSIFPQIIERIDGLAAQMRKGNSTIRSTMTIYADDDVEIWREWRRDLIRSGVRSSDIHRYSPALKTYLLRLKRDGMLDEEEPSPPVNNVPTDDAERQASPTSDDIFPGTGTLPKPLRPAGSSDDLAGVNLSTIAEEPNDRNSKATTYQSPSVEDAPEYHYDTDSELDVDCQDGFLDAGLPELDDLTVEDHVANVESTRNAASTAPKVIGTSASPFNSDPPNDVNQDLQSHLSQAEALAETRADKQAETQAETQAKAQPKAQPSVPTTTRRTDASLNREDYKATRKGSRNAEPANDPPQEQSKSNETFNSNGPGLLKRKLRTVRRFTWTKDEDQVPTSKPKNTPATEDVTREVNHRAKRSHKKKTEKTESLDQPEPKKEQPPPPTPQQTPQPLKRDLPTGNLPPWRTTSMEGNMSSTPQFSYHRPPTGQTGTNPAKNPTFSSRPINVTTPPPPPPSLNSRTQPTASDKLPSSPRPTTSSQLSIEFQRLPREQLHPSQHKPMVLPEGWDFRLDSQNCVFYVDTYARYPEKHCFWLPPVREKPSLALPVPGWRRVTNVFGRVHWVHDESKVVSYAPPDQVKKFRCYEGSFAVWDDDEQRYRMWYHFVSEGKKIVVDDSDIACQIVAAVWDRGISDEAVKVRGDLWWGAEDVRESNLRLTRSNGRTITINRDASNRATK